MKKSALQQVLWKIRYIQSGYSGFFENIQQYKPELDLLLTNNFELLNAD